MATDVQESLPFDGSSGAASERNPWIAATLSALIPGLGHVYVRRYGAALMWFAPFGVAFVAAAVVSPDLRSIANAAVSTPVLWTVFSVNIVAAVWRIASAVDAFRVSGGLTPRWSTPFAFVGAAAISLLIVVPHVAAGDLTFDAIRLVNLAFVADGEDVGTPVIPIGTDADEVPDPVVATYEVAATSERQIRGRIFEPGVGDPDAVDTWKQQHSGESSLPGAPLLPYTERVGTDRVTILFAGGDAGPGRGGMRTDTMMVATIDPANGKAAIFGFPRNFGSTPLPTSWNNPFEALERRLIAENTKPTTTTTGGSTTTTIPFEGCNCFPEQLNALYPFTRKWTGSYPNDPDPGMAALRDVLSHVSGLDIDYYALVDMAAFVDLIDAIGGVEVYVQEPLVAEVSPPREGDPWAKVDVGVGWQDLDGPEALAFVRARKNSSDYARMERQRCMLRAIAAKSTPFTLLRNFGGIVDALDGTLVTDIPVSFAPDLLTIAANLDFNDIATFGFRPGYYAHEKDVLRHVIPDVDRIRSKIRSVIRDQEAGVVESGDSTGSECDPPE